MAAGQRPTSHPRSPRTRAAKRGLMTSRVANPPSRNDAHRDLPSRRQPDREAAASDGCLRAGRATAVACPSASRSQPDPRSGAPSGQGAPGPARRRGVPARTGEAGARRTAGRRRLRCRRRLARRPRSPLWRGGPSQSPIADWTGRHIAGAAGRSSALLSQLGRPVTFAMSPGHANGLLAAGDRRGGRLAAARKQETLARAGRTCSWPNSRRPLRP